MDWSLLACGTGGHVTYAPDEPAVRSTVKASTPAGQAWRCLRCGTFVAGPPAASGPAAAAPQVRRGRELRSALILRLFAAERFLRAVISAILAYGIWRFSSTRLSVEQAFNRELPAMRTLLGQLGYNVDHSRLLGLVQHAFTLNQRTLTYLALGAAGYALIEIVEGAGLWLLKRWGEYFAMIATSLGLPYEVYDLTAKVTVVRLAAPAINLALVVYLVVTKRLFGVRGGKHAYEARLRSDSVLYAAAGQPAASPAPAPAAPAHAPPGQDEGSGGGLTARDP
jgi:uncharacterized membrane protein (DUF2068 family)